MESAKRTRLRAQRWRVGSAAEFLELTREEAALVETKLLLPRSVRRRRTVQNVSRAVLAKWSRANRNPSRPTP
jgi:hypothetical protein